MMIKCPPYCRVNCNSKHHPLLVVLLNCGDTDEQSVMKQRLHDLKHVVCRYEASGKWHKDDSIPDIVTTYRFPLLHWACALGRSAAVEWLIQHGLSPTTRTTCDEQQETALHRAIICLQETCPNGAVEKFLQLLAPLQDALFTRDGVGNLPIHTLCEFLANEMPRPEFYQGCVVAIIEHLKKQDGLLSDLFDNVNTEGNTALHILCRNDRCFPTVVEFMQAGATIETKNFKGQTALDVALEKGQVKLVRYLYDDATVSDSSDKSRAQHSKRTPKVATRKVYDSKGMVIGEEVKVMLKNKKRSLEESPSSPSKRSAVSESDEEEQRLAPAIINSVPDPALRKKLTDYTDQQFLQFLYDSGPDLQKAVLAKLRAEKAACTHQIEFMKVFQCELKQQQDDVTARQCSIVQQIQELLSKLSKVQGEESRIAHEVSNIEHDLEKITQSESTYKERLKNCSEALAVLVSAVEETK